MDGTKLDIWLVNSFTKMPYARAEIIASVDVFSRNIWGYYISLDAPNVESVKKAILNGLCNKQSTIDWKVFEEVLLKKARKINSKKVLVGSKSDIKW